MTNNVIIDYTSYRGNRRKREIEPNRLRFGTSHFHPEPQWLLDAVEIESGEWRTYAMKDVHSWEPKL